MDFLELVKFEGFENIFGPENFHEEFMRNILDTPPHAIPSDGTIPEQNDKFLRQCVKWLYTSLNQLDELGPQATKLKGFEKLPGTDDIYSARYPNTRKNPRFLYFFIQGKNVILLCPFLEKSGSDYKRAISLAEARKKELKSQWPLDENGGTI